MALDPDFTSSEDTDRLDAIGRRAGAELRRPAPPGGAAAVQRSARHRRIVTAVGGGVAVAALVVGGIVVASRIGADSVVTDNPPPTFAQPEPTRIPMTSAPVAAPERSTPTTPPPDTTPASDTTLPAGTTVPARAVIATTLAGESDEVLPDPDGFAADGYERALVGGDLIVRSDPEQVIPLDLPESDVWLLGVGPNGVAYLGAESPTTDRRILAVPTAGPTTGAVYELANYHHDGPWLGDIAPEGILPMSNTDGPELLPYVDPDGRPLDDPIDPTFTWRREYRLLDDGNVQPAVVDPDGNVYEVPTTEPGNDSMSDEPIRPLPDGRVVLWVLPSDYQPEIWALDPATATWTVHPAT